MFHKGFASRMLLIVALVILVPAITAFGYRAFNPTSRPMQWIVTAEGKYTLQAQELSTFDIVIDNVMIWGIITGAVLLIASIVTGWRANRTNPNPNR